MSGGVDSSVAAYLLKKEGFCVEGLFMKNWEEDDRLDYCAAAEDLSDAQQVCDKLHIPLHYVNFSQAYWDDVFQSMLDEYAKARTPNPDVLCNQHIKFKVFLEYATSLGADAIATGHYAQIAQRQGRPCLLKSKDRSKDQTYFLHAMPPSALTRTYFPVGGYLKQEVRALAASVGLPNSDKKDSTGLCFIGERRFKSFLREYLLTKPGPIMSTDGVCVGRHDGLMFYTLGQRQGLSIGGQKNNPSNLPWYVVEKTVETNTLWVAQGAHHPMLYAKGLRCGPIHWLSSETTCYPLTCSSKTRYRQADVACLVSSADESGYHTVMFVSPERAVTPGQYIVFYDHQVCLGGAVIEEIIR